MTWEHAERLVGDAVTLPFIHEARDGVGQAGLVQRAAVDVTAGERPVQREHVVVRRHKRLFVARGPPLRRRSRRAMGSLRGRGARSRGRNFSQTSPRWTSTRSCMRVNGSGSVRLIVRIPAEEPGAHGIRAPWAGRPGRLSSDYRRTCADTRRGAGMQVNQGPAAEQQRQTRHSFHPKARSPPARLSS